MYEKVGEATETALVVLAEKMNVLGIDRSKLSSKALSSASTQALQKLWNKDFTLEFSRDRKSMSCYCLPVKADKAGATPKMFVKVCMTFSERRMNLQSVRCNGVLSINFVHFIHVKNSVCNMLNATTTTVEVCYSTQRIYGSFKLSFYIRIKASLIFGTTFSSRNVGSPVIYNFLTLPKLILFIKSANHTPVSGKLFRTCASPIRKVSMQIIICMNQVQYLLHPILVTGMKCR